MTAYSEIAKMESERRGRQIERMLLLIDLLKTVPGLHVSQMADRLRVCQRTIRRDLDILCRLNWVTPAENTVGQTIWNWLRDKRVCECCKKPCTDTTQGSTFCGDCDGGYCNGKH